MDDHDHDAIDDVRLFTTLNKLCWMLCARRHEGIATLPLFERVMLLHVTILLRVWLWARNKQ